MTALRRTGRHPGLALLFSGLTVDDSSFSRRDAVRAIAESLVDGAHLDAIEAVVEQTLVQRHRTVTTNRAGRTAGSGPLECELANVASKVNLQ